MQIRYGALSARRREMAAWTRQLYSSGFAQRPRRGDWVSVNNRIATILYGPDFQGDMQVMYGDVFPEFFHISGDMNTADPGVVGDAT